MERQLMRSERWSEKPQDEGSTPSRSTISGTIDEMVKSPAPQAGGCGFNSHWYHQSIRCVRRIGRVTSLSRWSLWVRPPYASPFYGRVAERKLQQTVNLPPLGYVGSNPTSPTNIAEQRSGFLVALIRQRHRFESGLRNQSIWLCSSVGQNASLSRWRSRVQAPPQSPKK